MERRKMVDLLLQFFSTKVNHNLNKRDLYPDYSTIVIKIIMWGYYYYLYYIGMLLVVSM